MYEAGNNPLLAEVAENRRVNASQEQAKKELPGFTLQLAELILAKVPEPETVLVKLDLRRAFERSRRVGALDTRLGIFLPFGESETKIVIASSAYPKSYDLAAAMRFDYQIYLEEADPVFDIKNLVGTISSRREQESIKNAEGMGILIPSFNDSSRSVLMEDLEAYRLLFETFNQEGVRFEGTTPKVEITDSCGMRAKQFPYR